MAREYLMALHETSYGSADLTTGAPTAGSFKHLRIAGDNRYTPRETPVLTEIPFGGGLNMPGLEVNDFNTAEGTLQTELYYSQASLLLGWLISRINSGRTTPWTTTDSGLVMPPGDLASLSLYHAVMRSDGTYRRKRTAGAKPADFRLEVSRQNPITTLNITVHGQKVVGNQADSSSDPDATEFPFPSDSDYPTDPVVFSHSSGGLTIGSVRTLYESLTLSVRNVLMPLSYESKHPSGQNFYGREVTLAAVLDLKASPDDRTALEARTDQAVSLVFTNGANTITLDLNGKCKIQPIEDNLALGDRYKYTLTLKSFYDTAVGGDQPDLSFTYA